MSREIFPLILTNVVYEAGGQVLLKDICMEIQAEGRTLILGPNGAGKSLLLRLCHGLLSPAAGRIEWHAHSQAEAMRAQAMVFQRPVMLRRSVAGNILYALAGRGVAHAQRHLRVADDG